MERALCIPPLLSVKVYNEQCAKEKYKVELKKYTGGLMVAMMLLMAISRADHFGSATHLPDASWAVFLLAGFYLPYWVFPMLLLEAGAVDYWAIHYGGVSDWCLTPAYWFLIPTYAVLWSGGRFYATRYKFSLSSLLECVGIVLMVTSMAFLISNASFYWLGNYFNSMSVAQYAARVAQYLPAYVQGVLLYLGFAIVLHAVAIVGSRQKGLVP